MGTSFLSEPIFWAFVAAMSAGIVVIFYVVREAIRQALIDAHFEIERREREEKEKRTRGGLR